MKTEKSFASIAGKFVMKIGTKLLSGSMNVLSITPPAEVLHSQSYTEIVLDSWVIYQKYAYEAWLVKDPLERMKLISAGFTANKYIVDVNSKGLIPISVWKDEYCEASLSNGTYGIVNVVEKDPLKQHIRLVGPDECYTLDITQELKV